MPQKKYPVDLTDLEKLELEKLLESGAHQSRKLTRVRILLLANDGKTDEEIVKAAQTARPTVERTRKQFVEEGLDCLQEKLRHGARPRLDAPSASALEAPSPVRQRRKDLRAGHYSYWRIKRSNSALSIRLPKKQFVKY